MNERTKEIMVEEFNKWFPDSHIDASSVTIARAGFDAGFEAGLEQRLRSLPVGHIFTEEPVAEQPVSINVPMWLHDIDTELDYMQAIQYLIQHSKEQGDLDSRAVDRILTWLTEKNAG